MLKLRDFSACSGILNYDFRRARAYGRLAVAPSGEWKRSAHVLAQVLGFGTFVWVRIGYNYSLSNTCVAK